MSVFVELKKALDEKAVLMVDAVVDGKKYSIEYIKCSDVLELVAGLEQQVKDKAYVECPDCCAKLQKETLTKYHGRCCDCGRNLLNEKPFWLKLSDVFGVEEGDPIKR